MLEQNEANDLPSALIEGHKRFLSVDFAGNKERYTHLAEGQSPQIMWIGCADSRVPAERILGAELGDLFLLRNVGNIVPPLEADESSVGSALHFAVDRLRVSHLVVCGHSDCGGIKSLVGLSSAALDPMLSSWVEYAIPALEDCVADSPDAVARANVVYQAENLLGYPCVKSAVAEGRLAIHACYYEIGSGRLEQFDPISEAWRYIV